MAHYEWPISYQDARLAFLAASERSGVAVDTKMHTRKGSQYEDLGLDIARIGRNDSRKILVIMSGTHGVEGYCGSACQTAWLKHEVQPVPDIAIYVLHAVNPFGFSHNRRVNEDNIDLNRNFLDFAGSNLPTNIEYRELEFLLNPRSLDETTIGKLNPQLAEWFATPAKVSSFKAAV